jgi:hypothetical protein
MANRSATERKARDTSARLGVEHHGEGQREERRSLLPWHDDERLQAYVAMGHDLVQKTPLGHQLECFRDNVRIVGMPATHPPGDWGYSTGTAYHRARETALRLWDTERAFPGSVGALWEYCSPLAVSLDGLPGGRGRIFCVYPRTALGRVARRSAVVKDESEPTQARLLGPRDCKCPVKPEPEEKNGEAKRGCICFSRHTLARRLYAESAAAKGERLNVWNQIHSEAEQLLHAARDAWFSTRGAEDERRLQYRDRRRTAARAQAITVAGSDG